MTPPIVQYPQKFRGQRMSKLNHQRDLLRLIDDAEKARREPLEPRNGGVQGPLTLGNKRPSFDGFIIRCASHHLDGKPMPPLPKKLKGLVDVGNGKYADILIRRWLATRVEFENAVKKLMNKRNTAKAR
ncbi:hypothetical protein [Rhizobium sp. TAL182]|uniref:hypothetical protein n=1 Tax=Rhizobium sp. TAL182 TaxID=2020313 RepID=UPI000F741C5D|nr:hypothetical protein [Rhizobium sp. TAL182]